MNEQINIDEITDITKLKALRGDQFMEREAGRKTAEDTEQRTTAAINLITGRIELVERQNAEAAEAKIRADELAAAPSNGADSEGAKQDMKPGAREKATTPNV
jgi:hypothetical protein